jgi:hypothetical protein
MIDTLKFDLASLERILDDADRPLANSINGLLLEIAISPDFEAAIIANKHRFVRHVLSPTDTGAARGALSGDFNVGIGHADCSP